MSRESSRRFGAVNFEKSQYEQLADPMFVGVLLDGLIEEALKVAGMTLKDDFSLRLVVTENLPEDRPDARYQRG